jgi:hypothetical protein
MGGEAWVAPVAVSALASHHCDPGSIPGLGVIWELSLLLTLPYFEGFSPGSPVFLSPHSEDISTTCIKVHIKFRCIQHAFDLSCTP